VRVPPIHTSSFLFTLARYRDHAFASALLVSQPNIAPLDAGVGSLIRRRHISADPGESADVPCNIALGARPRRAFVLGGCWGSETLARVRKRAGVRYRLAASTRKWRQAAKKVKQQRRYEKIAKNITASAATEEKRLASFSWHRVFVAETSFARRRAPSREQQRLQPASNAGGILRT